MKSKMLLATPKGGFGEYTHIVGVERFETGGLVAFGYSNGFGTINPQDFEDTTVFGIYIVIYSNISDTETLTVLILGAKYVGDIYIGRESIDLAEKFSISSLLAGFYLNLFFETDVGKDVPIWLATTPPPLVSGLKRATLSRLKYTHSGNCDLFKEVA